MALILAMEKSLTLSNSGSKMNLNDFLSNDDIALPADGVIALIKQNREPLLTNDQDQSLLQEIIFNHHRIYNAHEVVAYLCETEIDINIQDALGDTALITACSLSGEESNVRMFERSVNILLENGADIHKTDKYNETCLHAALFGQDTPLVVLAILQADETHCLANQLSDINSPSSLPLGIAADHGFIHSLTHLLDHGAHINAQDTKGMSALMHAGEWGHSDVFELLLTRGGDPFVIDDNGMSAIDYAQASDEPKMALIAQSIALKKEAGQAMDSKGRGDGLGL